MNIWRGIGDGSHLVAMILLLAGIWRYKSARTVSLRTQELYMAVFSTRYLDLWIGRFISYYNTSMKIIYLSITLATILSMRFRFADGLSPQDSWRWLLFIPAVAVLAVLVNYRFTFMEVCWSFSIYLESVAAIPQLFLIRALKECQDFVLVFMALMGLYRLMYVFNWGHRYVTEEYLDFISVTGGVSQVLFYLGGVVYVLYRRRGRVETEYNSDTGTIEFREYTGVHMDPEAFEDDSEDEDEEVDFDVEAEKHEEDGETRRHSEGENGEALVLAGNGGGSGGGTPRQ